MANIHGGNNGIHTGIASRTGARGLKKALLRLVLDVRERVTGMGRCGESGNKGVFLL